MSPNQHLAMRFAALSVITAALTATFAVQVAYSQQTKQPATNPKGRYLIYMRGIT